MPLWCESANRPATTLLRPTQAPTTNIMHASVAHNALNNTFRFSRCRNHSIPRPTSTTTGNKTDLDAFEVSAALRSIGLEMLLQEPLSTLACCLVRCFSILTFPLNLAICPPAEPYAPDRLVAAAKGGIYLALLVWVLVRLFMERPLLEQVYFPLACTLALLLASTP